MPAASTGNPVLDAIMEQLLKENQEVAFNVWADPFLSGTRGQNPFANWLRGSYFDQIKGNYLGQLPTNPEQDFYSYLKTQDPLAQFAALAPSQRGISFSRFAPRVTQKPFGFA